MYFVSVYYWKTRTLALKWFSFEKKTFLSINDGGAPKCLVDLKEQFYIHGRKDML